MAMSTIGELERRAGIGQSEAERFAFWQPFAHLGDKALDAGVAQLRFLAERRDAGRSTS